MVRKVSLTILFTISALACFSQNREQWVDSVFQTLNTEEKIGQLLMVRLAANDVGDRERLIDLIKSFRIGGAILMHGGPMTASQLINEAQDRAPVPLLFGVQGLRGPGFTLDSILQIPPPLVLNSIRSDSLVDAAANEVARQMKLLQLQINFMPLANTDLATSSYPDKLLHFGTNPLRTTRAADIMLNGLHRHNIISCAQQDLRWTPVAVKTDLVFQGVPDTALFHPYRDLVKRGLKGILTTRLPYFYIEKNKGLPAFVSQIFVSEDIKQSLGFQGLTFTDIPALQQVVSKPRGGETEMLAFQVGNDILIDPQNISATVRKIKRSLRKNETLQNHLDATVRKILTAKFDAGLANRTPIDTDNLLHKLNSRGAILLSQKLSRESVTLVTNESGIVPIKTLTGKKFAVISIGMETENIFSHTISKYAPTDRFSIRLPEDTVKLKRLNEYDAVIVAAFPFSQNLLPGIAPSLHRLTDHPLILVHFGDPTVLSGFNNYSAVITGYTDDPVVQRSTAEMIFGAIGAKGRLPLTITNAWREGTGSSISTINRLGYALPEEVGMDSKTLDRIAVVAREAIDSIATPGCHVLVARKGKIVYDRSFGWYTYENRTRVTDETIYDLASVTKVLATLQAVMYLQEQGKIDVNKKASVYLPELANTNKKDITLKDMLTHQSGLLPFIPMWPQTIKEKSFDPYYYSMSPTETFPLEVAPGLFVANHIGDSAWRWVEQSRMLTRPPRTPFTYRYSDMGSMILHRISNRVMNEPMDKFLHRYFYEPMGAQTMGYNPLERFPFSQIAPTEIDTTYRKRTVWGTVHDERAAMLGGVAGHAGLFGNANDLVKICQMLLNGGNYGGIQFLKPETVEMFTKKQYDNSHRGLGWDKPNRDWNGSTSIFASPKTFGHTGFTGTCIWIDPEFDLIYIFLSNRVWPGRGTKLLRTNVRTRIQEITYRSIFNYCEATE